MSSPIQGPLSNGSGAAAVLAAALGCFALGVLALAGDASPHIAQALNFWKPTGPLSGVTDLAIIVWLGVWFALSRLWARRSVNLTTVNVASFALFAAGLLLTFPPFMDLLQGK
jgi:uncharacterized membrane protein (DUF4010 family)